MGKPKTRKPRRGTNKERHERPVRVLPGACAFAEDPTLGDPAEIVRLLRRFPFVLEAARRDARGLQSADGAPRIDGDYLLLYFAYVLSGETCIERFFRRFADSALWRECGFVDGHPSYQTVWLRFDELERAGVSEWVREAGDGLVQRARRHDGNVGRDVAVDGTAFQAHARLRHCCPDEDACRATGRSAKILRSASGETAQAERHRTTEGPPTEVGDPTDSRLQSLDDDGRRELGLPDRGRYFVQRGHVYQSLDHEAGSRKHGKEFWHGGTLMAGVDIYSGAPIAVKAIGAHVNEHAAYPDLLDRMEVAAGGPPDRVTADRAQSIESIFELNTRKGIASIFPFRKHGAIRDRERLDRDEYDRHGQPRCRHCGGPGSTLVSGAGFCLTVRGEPVLRFKCEYRPTEDCNGVQEIACQESWRMLLPLSRLHPAYHAMHAAGKQREQFWNVWRERYSVAGKTPETRTRRRLSVTCQEFRAQVARVLDWFRLCFRQGWLGSHRRRNGNSPTEVDGERALQSLIRARHRHMLDLPYGRYAETTEFAANANPPPADARGTPDDVPEPEVTR